VEREGGKQRRRGDFPLHCFVRSIPDIPPIKRGGEGGKGVMNLTLKIARSPPLLPLFEKGKGKRKGGVIKEDTPAPMNIFRSLFHFLFLRGKGKGGGEKKEKHKKRMGDLSRRMPFLIPACLASHKKKGEKRERDGKGAC